MIYFVKLLWKQQYNCDSAGFSMCFCGHRIQLISRANARGFILPLRSAGVSSECGRRWGNSWWRPGPGTARRHPGWSGPAGWGSAAGRRLQATMPGTRMAWEHSGRQRSAQDPWLNLEPDRKQLNVMHRPKIGTQRLHCGPFALRYLSHGFSETF